MTAIIIRYQFHDAGTRPVTDLHDLLKSTYGGAIQHIAEGTILVDTLDTAEEVFSKISRFFTFDDKLFVGEMNSYRSMHNIPRTKPSIHRIAI